MLTRTAPSTSNYEQDTVGDYRTRITECVFYAEQNNRC